MIPDRELLERWAAGDPRGGEALVQRHYGAVFRFFRAKVTTEIEDLAQQTFLALAQGIAGFRGESSFRSYLFGTARNVLLHHWRRRGRKDDHIDFGTHSVVDLGASPSAFVAEKGDRRLLLEALRRIPVDDQIVIELYHWEELGAREVAQALGISEAAVRSRLHRAKARLADAMAQLGGSPNRANASVTDLDAWAQNVRQLLDPAPRHDE